MSNPYEHLPASVDNVVRYMQYEYGIDEIHARSLANKYESDIEISESAGSHTFYVAEIIMDQEDDTDCV